jgi:hypothetical protein
LAAPLPLPPRQHLRKMAEPEPQADWSEQERAVLAKGDAFLSDGPFSLESGCPGWIKSADYEGSSDVWRGQGCVLFVGDDGKGRTMPFKTTGIVYGVEPATLLAHMTSMDMKWRDKVCAGGTLRPLCVLTRGRCTHSLAVTLHGVADCRSGNRWLNWWKRSVHAPTSGTSSARCPGLCGTARARTFPGTSVCQLQSWIG